MNSRMSVYLTGSNPLPMSRSGKLCFSFGRRRVPSGWPQRPSDLTLPGSDNAVVQICSDVLVFSSASPAPGQEAATSPRNSSFTVYQNQNLAPRNASATDSVLVSKNLQHSCEKYMRKSVFPMHIQEDEVLTSLPLSHLCSTRQIFMLRNTGGQNENILQIFMYVIPTLQTQQRQHKGVVPRPMIMAKNTSMKYTCSCHYLSFSIMILYPWCQSTGNCTNSLHFNLYFAFVL